MAITTTVEHPTDALARTARLRTVGLATALFVAPWFIVAANTGDAITKLNGGDDLKPEDALAIARDHLALDRWSSFAALLGSLLLVPAVLGVMRAVRVGAARVGLAGCVLMAAGYIAYFGIVFQGMIVDAMVRAGGSTTQHVDVLDAAMDEPLTIWVYLLFVLGNIVGTFLVGLALIRARTVPRAAGYLLIGWPVCHLSGLPFSEVVGAVLQAVALAMVGAVLLRGTRPDAVEAAPYELLRR
jgi:hypothetical protein